MTESADAVRRHYEPEASEATMLEQVRQTLASFGHKDGAPVSPTAAQLATLDQFHVRGLAATRELAEMAGVTREMRVLDAGSGLGGPSRFLAETYGCHVTGVDLTPAFVAGASLITERVGLAEQVQYQIGDLLALPFPDAHFDLVWTQHVVMNIRDRASLYRELRRVLKPGGHFAFYDILAGPNTSPLVFPLPWAASEATSFLLTPEATRQVYEQSGLAVRQWSDETPKVAASMAQMTPNAPNANVTVLPGVDRAAFLKAVANVGLNLREGRLCFAMGVCEAG